MCNKCNNKKREFKYYKTDFGKTPVKVQHMDLIFDMFEKETKVHSKTKMEILENVSELKLDA